MADNTLAESSSAPRKLVPFAQGLRPFFLLAGLDAIFNIAVWLAVYFDPQLWLTDAVPAMYWHGHEMLFGFVAAAIGGFLLTAVPGWTGRSSYAGAPLFLLAATWLVGRIAMLAWIPLPALARAIVDLAFFPALVLTLTPPLIRARKIRNLPFALLLILLFASDLVFHLGSLSVLGTGEPTGLAMAADIVLLLIAVVGGRIIPAFTRSGLARHGIAVNIDVHRVIEVASVGGILAVLVCDMVAPDSQVNGILCLITALVNAARLAQWHGHRTWRDPLIWVLHLGYAWLVIGFALKGMWLMFAAPFAAKWLHAFTIGAFATMILAVMTRASLGHTGRVLIASRSMTAAYLLVSAAALVRVFAPAIVPAQYDVTIAIAGACWLLAFLLFVIVYAPILMSPRADRRPG